MRRQTVRGAYKNPTRCQNCKHRAASGVASLLPSALDVAASSRRCRARSVELKSIPGGSQLNPRRLQNPPSEAPKSSQDHPGGSQEALQERLRASQERPRASQERPKSALRAPQERPRAPRESPKSTQDSPRAPR